MAALITTQGVGFTGAGSGGPPSSYDYTHPTNINVIHRYSYRELLARYMDRLGMEAGHVAPKS